MKLFMTSSYLSRILLFPQSPGELIIALNSLGSILFPAAGDGDGPRLSILFLTLPRDASLNLLPGFPVFMIEL